MEDNEGGDGVGGEPIEQFHRNEAISAVADDGFMVEEDDDYEDLYNDVNVGENFLQSFRKNEDLVSRNEEVERKPEQPVLPAPPPVVAAPQVVDESGRDDFQGVGGERNPVKEEDVVSGIAARASVGPAVSGTSAGSGFRVELSHPSSKMGDLAERMVNSNVPNQVMAQQPHGGGVAVAAGNLGNVGNMGNDNLIRQGGVNMNGAGNIVAGVGVASGGGGGGGGGGATILFVGDLHWWTTDAELEAELSKYGHVKEVKFFEEKASGKSKGYCQVEFHDSSAATACKESMNGHMFNGRPCVVAYASSPYNVKRMGEAQVNRNQQVAQTAVPQARRGPGEAAGKIGNNNTPTGGNYQGGGGGGGDGNRGGYGRGSWGRGGPQAMGNRGPVGPMRNRPGGIAGRGMMGNGGGGFGQGMGGAPPIMHPQTMMGQGFDPAFGGPMGRMGGYGGFPGGPAPPFPGMLSSFPPVGGVGMPGVAPHVNPAFFGRGMPMNGMGMMPGAGMEGPNMGMWSEPNAGGWAGDEHGGRAGESSYAEEAGSDHQYGETTHDRGAWPNNVKEKDRGSERDWSGSTERKHREGREPSYDRDMAREKDRGHDQDWPEKRYRDDRDVARDRERDRDHERPRERGRDRERDRDRDRHRDDRDRYADHHRYKDREMAGWASLPSNPKFHQTVSIWGPTTTHIITNAAALRLGDALHRRLQSSIKHIFCHVHGPILKDACHKWTLHVTGFNILQWSQDVFSAEDMSLLFFSADESRRKFRNIQNSYSKSSRSFFSSKRKWTNIFLALNILIYIAQVATEGKLLFWGAKINSLIDKGQLWRLITSSFLHTNIVHLMVNCYSLNSVGPGVEKVSGPKRYVALYLTSAIASSAMSYWLSKAPAVGASGAIFGLVGSFAVFILRHRGMVKGTEGDLRYIANVIVLNLAIGLMTKGIDNWGHLGGLMGGAATSWLLGPAWEIQSISSEGRRVFADTAPIFSLIPTKRDKS